MNTLLNKVGLVLGVMLYGLDQTLNLNPKHSESSLKLLLIGQRRSSVLSLGKIENDLPEKTYFGLVVVS